MSLPARLLHRHAPSERVVDPESAFWPEHRSRYRWAAGRRRRGRTLDLGCGGGLGLSILTSVSGSDPVVAVDIVADAVEAASTADGAMLCQADASRLPFGDGVFATVTCFEVIEHVPDASAVVAEVRRVLATDGCLLVSTPNARFTRPVEGRPRNPFHFHEFTRAELRGLLERAFEVVDVYGQRPGSRYGSCAFWDVPPGGLIPRVRLLAWKVGYRFPPRLRERISHALFRRTFFPGEDEFEFVEEGVDGAHALVASCRRPRPSMSSG